MRYSSKIALLVAAGLLCVAATTSKQKAVYFRDLPQGVIFGELGKPLGTFCKIQGTVEKVDRYESKANSANAIRLRIEKVDGEPLVSPYAYTFGDGIPDLQDQPNPGSTFTYVGYETGSFVGPLADPKKLVPNRVDDALITQNNWGPVYNLRLTLNVVTPDKK